MKKLIYLIIVAFCFLVTSCENGTNNNNIKSTTELGNGIGTIYKIEFEGHTYLVRESNYVGYRGYGGMCHDENCQCKTDSVKEK